VKERIVAISHGWRREKRRICSLIRKARPIVVFLAVFPKVAARAPPRQDDASATLQTL
jgi:hypothetical protein